MDSTHGNMKAIYISNTARNRSVKMNVVLAKWVCYNCFLSRLPDVVAELD